MNAREDPPLTPMEERVQSVVRSLPRTQADPAFRNRLRREFSTGRFEPHVRPAEPKIAGWFTWPWAMAATAVLCVIAFGFLNRGPDWRVTSATDLGAGVTVNGITIPASTLSGPERSKLQKALGRGGHLIVPEGTELTLLSEGVLLVQAAPGTDIDLPTPPGRWIGKNMSTRVTKGEARILTGSRFPGRRMSIETPVGYSEITGTLVSVVTDGSFTCVCVAEGTVSVGKSTTTMEFVPATMRKVMFADKRPSVLLPIENHHADGLAAFMHEHGGEVGR